jgi:hypothetical protein
MVPPVGSLLINAPGGDLYSGAALVDCLRSRETSIYTVVLGIAASVAYLLAITATGRYGMPHCRLIHHGIEGGSGINGLGAFVASAQAPTGLGKYLMRSTSYRFPGFKNAVKSNSSGPKMEFKKAPKTRNPQ